MACGLQEAEYLAGSFAILCMIGKKCTILKPGRNTFDGALY